MSNIKYASDELTESLRKNARTVVKELQKTPPNNAWVYKFISGEKFIAKKYEIEDFKLKIPKDEKDTKAIYEDAIILYENLKHLPGYILSDERFWLWLMLEKFYEATLRMMPITKEATFKDHWLFTQGKRRGIFFGVLSRLYFNVALSVDKNNEDPYLYTKFAFENRERIRGFTWRTYSSEPHIVLGALKGVKRFLDENEKTEEDPKSYPVIAKYISQLGSVKLLDVMDEQYIEEKVYNRLQKYYEAKTHQ